MKTSTIVTVLAAAVLTACDPPAGKPKSAATAESTRDIPLLPVTKGDRWTYDVRLEIPADVTSPGAAEVDANHQRVRSFLGKVIPAEGLPETDCFEVTSPGTPTEREFVEIHQDKVLMRGSAILRPESTRPMWLEHPVTFVVAGMKPGTESPEINAPGGSLSRKTQVVGREDVTVPAGTFPCIRLLMTGTDGELELRRTLWFAPGTGIVREEKSRYRKGKLIFRETHQLVKSEMAVKR
jgi:hypothetical protein